MISSQIASLNHPLILEIWKNVSDTQDHNSMIATEFLENGSLATNLFSTECLPQFHLSGANKIGRIVVGIVLSMRYLHSQNVIHGDLTPANILLDREWNVRISIFRQNISPNNPCSFLSGNVLGSSILGSLNIGSLSQSSEGNAVKLTNAKLSGCPKSCFR
jgi:serine/threonine protein kinase